jgi:hypothetical protein
MDLSPFRPPPDANLLSRVVSWQSEIEYELNVVLFEQEE